MYDNSQLALVEEQKDNLQQALVKKQEDKSQQALVEEKIDNLQLVAAKAGFEGSNNQPSFVGLDYNSEDRTWQRDPKAKKPQKKVSFSKTHQYFRHSSIPDTAVFYMMQYSRWCGILGGAVF